MIRLGEVEEWNTWHYDNTICLSEKLWIGLLLLDGGQGQSYEVDTVDTETKENITFPTLGLWVSQRRQ